MESAIERSIYAMKDDIREDIYRTEDLLTLSTCRRLAQTKRFIVTAYALGKTVYK